MSPVKLRPARPSTVAVSATRVTLWVPKERASAGATAPNAAKARTGSMVSTPATVPDMPRVPVSSSSTGPTLTAAGRRLKPSTTMPTTTSTFSKRVSRTGAVVVTAPWCPGWL